MHLPYDPPIMLIDIYPKELKTLCTHKNLHIVFVAALIIIVQIGKQPKSIIGLWARDGNCMSDPVLMSYWEPSLYDFWPDKLPVKTFSKIILKIYHLVLIVILWRKHSILCTEFYNRYRFLILNFKPKSHSEVAKHKFQSLLSNLLVILFGKMPNGNYKKPSLYLVAWFMSAVICRIFCFTSLSFSGKST